MTHPLDGARLKVVRAQQHLDALKDKIRAYLESNPYHVPAIQHRMDYAAQGVEFAVSKPIVGKEPPVDLSCVIGDCVTNLRASLDYVAWQIAMRHMARPPVVGKDRRICFPISINGMPPDRLPELAKKYAFPAGAISGVESVQPYHAGYEPLTTLERLVNQDKHCLLVVAVMCADVASVNVNGLIRPSMRQITVHVQGFGTIIRTSCNNNFAVPTAPCNVAPGQATASVRAGDVEVQGEIAAFVSLQDPTVPHMPVEILLEDVIKCVANIIPRFEPFV